ncbi:MAG: hypothetical protein WAV27_10135 [Xanthobacteraceae bacterium]|jgi:hypothetical protein
MPMFEIDLPMNIIAANYSRTSPVSGQLFGQAALTCLIMGVSEIKNNRDYTHLSRLR